MTKIKSIRKILIANRGEIAARIIRSCKTLNIATVAVYSDIDADSLHVQLADEAFHLPGTTSRETYLNQELVLSIGEKYGCDAIHPGYGFLSENPGFARACTEKNIIFIGPPPEAIEDMGIKTTARKCMMDAGIPVVPGTDPLKDFKQCETEAGRIGYPLLIKASAGGGGKGMRLVNDPKNLKKNHEACQREARSAFGDSRVYLEKYFIDPHHIEFQILADAHGNVIHLNERECSIQRRYQKIVEEAPSPLIDDRLRKQMGKVATDVARACQYVNAGTVEFLVDSEKNFYFLEMNTRLQVEHPVTEMVTGIDLVAEQIRIAEGKPLSVKETPPAGAAIECRIYAEDPAENFMPCAGTVTEVLKPDGPGIRNDAGIFPGAAVPQEYDPIIAKLITWGSSRSEAIQRMLQALAEYTIVGIRNNIPYLERIISHRQFKKGRYDTSFISRYEEDLRTDPSPLEKETALTAAVIIHLHQKNNGHTAGQTGISPWKLSGRISQLKP